MFALLAARADRLRIPVAMGAPPPHPVSIHFGSRLTRSDAGDVFTARCSRPLSMPQHCSWGAAWARRIALLLPILVARPLAAIMGSARDGHGPRWTFPEIGLTLATVTSLGLAGAATPHGGDQGAYGAGQSPGGLRPRR
jgi:hypothetical protein